jgi:hypothetical protein
MTNEFSGPIPGHASIENNIRVAMEYRDSHPNLLDRLQWFREMVKPNKDRHLPISQSWDYKQIDKKYADFGNYNYGVTGIALGIPAELLTISAGAAQISSDKKVNLYLAYLPAMFLPNHGDNTEDQIQIIKGIAYAESLNLSKYPKSINPNFYITIQDLDNYMPTKERENYIK